MISEPSAYTTLALRFPDSDELDCEGRIGEPCTIADGKPAYAIHLVKGFGKPERLNCERHSPFANIYVPCTRCGEKPALADKRIEVDPLCIDCIREIVTEAAGRAFVTEAIVAAEEEEDVEDIDAGACPGYGEYCGNPVQPGMDLCPDCHTSRLDVESPRIPK